MIQQPLILAINKLLACSCSDTEARENDKTIRAALQVIGEVGDASALDALKSTVSKADPPWAPGSTSEPGDPWDSMRRTSREGALRAIKQIDARRPPSG